MPPSVNDPTDSRRCCTRPTASFSFAPSSDVVPSATLSVMWVSVASNRRCPAAWVRVRGRVRVRVSVRVMVRVRVRVR